MVMAPARGHPRWGGRRPLSDDERLVRSLARDQGPACIATLVELRDGCPDPRVRSQAAQALLDRGYGKPVTAVEMTIDAHVEPDEPEVDYEKLSIATLEELVRVAPGILPARSSPTTIDVEASDATS
jgi:hypothetical protein